MIRLQEKKTKLAANGSPRYEKKMKDKLGDEIKLAGLGGTGAGGAWEASVTQLESLANFRACALESRDVRGGEVRSENS